LFRAAASTSEYEVDTAVLMTIEGFVLESKTYNHAPAPETTEGGATNADTDKQD
jgi:hypothetical protein